VVESEEVALLLLVIEPVAVDVAVCRQRDAGPGKVKAAW
jgi:hypothetical protein